MTTNHNNICSSLGLCSLHRTFTHVNSFHLQSTGGIIIFIDEKMEDKRVKKSMVSKAVNKGKRKGEFSKVI